MPTTGLVAASFTHGVNRNLDPHLHTHVVMANMVHGADGRWSACDHRGLSAHRAAAAAVYDSHLRARLSVGLGVRWVDAPGLRAEVAGVSPFLLGEFSSRAADIRRHMAEQGAHSARGARVAWAATRPDEAGRPRLRRAVVAVGTPGAVGRHSRGRDGRAFSRRARWADRHRRSTSIVSERCCRWHPMARLAGGTSSPPSAPRRSTGADARSVEQLTRLWTPTSSDRAQVGVAEDTRTLRSVVPGGHLLATLGPRPVDPVRHEVWRDAARAIEDYRTQWGVTRAADALGADALPSGISSLPTERLIDHLQTARHIETACQRLGWRPARTREMDRGR